MERTDRKEGYLILSKKKGGELPGVGQPGQGLCPQRVGHGDFKERSKSGFLVDVGIEAFLENPTPISSP